MVDDGNNVIVPVDCNPLSDMYGVVSMDLPGFGLTGPYTDETTKYTSENYAAFVVELLDMLRLDRVTQSRANQAVSHTNLDIMGSTG